MDFAGAVVGSALGKMVSISFIRACATSATSPSKMRSIAAMMTNTIIASLGSGKTYERKHLL